jgi:hypothetical protein
MKSLLSRNPDARKEWLNRLDRIAGDLNVVLVCIALGLATLDATFLFTQKVIDSLPRVTRVVDSPAPANSPEAAPQK